MVFIFTFFIELFILFLLSRTLTQFLSHFFFRVTRSKNLTIQLLAFLFLPGTVLHEVSHALVAQLLMVRVGHMEFIPKLEGNHLKMGSVAIEQTDFFRRLLIGMAPFLIGTSLLLTIFFFAAQQHLFSNYWIILLIGYLVFEIGNTMFSSKKDMEGALEILAAIAIITLTLYIVGFRLPAIHSDAFFAHPLLIQVFQQGSLFLLAPLGIDLLIIILLRILLKHR